MNKKLLSMISAVGLVAGSAQAINFQHVNDIPGNITKSSGSLAGRITVITSDQRWTSDTVYILNNLTFVEPPAVLTIEPGTIIRGEEVTTGGTSTLDPADPGALIICRGAKIVAVGTAESPIYFTSTYDPFVPGGVATIPTRINSTTNNHTAETVAAKAVSDYATNNSTSGAPTAHKIDGKWGGLLVLGRAPVGFGGPSGSGGNLQVAISENFTNQAYTRNPTFTFSDGKDYKLEALFNPVGVAGLSNGTSGTFTKFPGTSLKATVADGSRTATRTVLNNIPVTVTNTSGSNVTANYTAVGQTLTNGDTVVVNWSEATFSNRGLQYNVPTKSGTAPFLSSYGYSGAEIALELTDSSAFSSAAVPTSLTNVANPVPTALLVLSNTYLYGVIVKAPGAGGVLTSSNLPTLTISGGGNSGTQATNTTSIAGAVADPSAIPLKGGIGANFIEGFQAIDGAAYGLTNSSTLSGGIYGGSDPADNSGTIRFCRFSFGGFVLSPNNEINGVTYGGAGSGTVTEFVEIFNNADDDFEMFGGNNNLRYCAGIFGGDDGFDTDMSYRGKGQFLFQLQNNQNGSGTGNTTGRPAGNVGDNLTENDGNEDPNSISNATYPGTEFTYFNYTGIGLGYTVGNSAKSDDRAGPNFKDNSGGKFLNSLFIEVPKGAVQIQAGTRFTDRISSNTNIQAAETVPGEPTGVLAYNTWSKCGGSAAADQTNSSKLFPTTSGRTSSGGSTINAAAEIGKLTNSQLSNIFTANQVINSSGTNGRLAGVDPTLADSVNERSNGTDPRDSAVVDTNSSTGLKANRADRGSFFARTTHRGAFKDFNWMKGWSLSDQLGVYAANNVVVPEVTLTRDSSGNAVANFPTATNVQYIVEASSDNKTYTPVATVTGNGLIAAQNTLRTGIVFVRVTPL